MLEVIVGFLALVWFVIRWGIPFALPLVGLYFLLLKLQGNPRTPRWLLRMLIVGPPDKYTDKGELRVEAAFLTFFALMYLFCFGLTIFGLYSWGHHILLNYKS